MTKFNELASALQTIQYNPLKAKSEFAKYKSDLTLDAICLTFSDPETKTCFLNYVVAKSNDLKLLEFVITLLDQNILENMLPHIKLALFEAIKLSNHPAYTILLRFIQPLNSDFNEIKSAILRFSNYRFIMNELKDKIDFSSAIDLLDIVQNNNDLAYLLTRFTQEIIITARDRLKNNVVHLSLLNQNKNIFRYVINHGGLELLYENNTAGITPIDMLYTSIKEIADKTHEPYDFTMLMLLDQIGADLDTEQHSDVYNAYKALPNYHHKFMLETQAKSDRKISAISFNGGGAKGAAFMAAYQEALTHNLIYTENVKEYAGTSAGAITAGIFAMNFDIGRCQNELLNFDFKQLMQYPTSKAIGIAKDSYVKNWIMYYQQGAYYRLISDMMMAIGTESMWGGPVTTALKELITDKTGIFAPTYLRETLHRLIKEKIQDTPLANIDPAHITFKDFKQHPNIFNAITVYITNLSTGKTEKCSAENSPNMSIVDGIIYSASFPVFFEAAQKYNIIVKSDGQRDRVPDLIDGQPVYCCDGGILKNDPVDAFDHDHFNEETLTFMLVSSDSKKQFEDQNIVEHNKISHVFSVLTQIYKLTRSVERKNIHNDARNHGRLIYIDTKNVGTLDFDHAKEHAPILAATGQDAVIDYLHRRTARSYSILSPKTISLLMSCGLAKHSASANGQVIEINPGKKLTPIQILRIYAAATDDEVNMLRSIINPNQRDAQCVSAVDIAYQKNLTLTGKRLYIAGANPRAPRVTAAVLPPYLNRGENFLQNNLSEEQLQKQDELLSTNEKLKDEIALLKSQQHLETEMSRNEQTKLNAKIEESKAQQRREAEANKNLEAEIRQLRAEKLQQTQAFIEEKQKLQIQMQRLRETQRQQMQAFSEEKQNLQIQMQQLREEQRQQTQAFIDKKQNLQIQMQQSQDENNNQLQLLNSENDELSEMVIKFKKQITILTSKYSNSRSSICFINSLLALQKHREELFSEFDKIVPKGKGAKLMSVDEAKVHAMSHELAVIDQVIKELKRQNDRSANDIIQNIQSSRLNFFSNTTKKLCAALIAAENSVEQPFQKH